MKNKVLEDILSMYDEEKNPDVKYLDVERDDDITVIVGFKNGQEIRIKIHEFKTAGRPNVSSKLYILNLKSKGYTQEQISRELNISLSTVRRNWK